MPAEVHRVRLHAAWSLIAATADSSAVVRSEPQRLQLPLDATQLARPCTLERIWHLPPKLDSIAAIDLCFESIPSNAAVTLNGRGLQFSAAATSDGHPTGYRCRLELPELGADNRIQVTISLDPSSPDEAILGRCWLEILE